MGKQNSERFRLSASSLLSPIGLTWKHLAEVLGGMPLRDFLKSCPAPFLMDVPQGTCAGAPGLAGRLAELSAASDLPKMRVYFLAPRRPGDALLVGRLQRIADVVLDDKTISKRHAEIDEGPNSWRVKDLESPNGTYHEGRRLRVGIPAPLKSGTLLRFAQRSCLFLSPADLHGLANPNRPQGKVLDLHEALLCPAQGRQVREFVRAVGQFAQEFFLKHCPADFLLQVPVDAPETQEELTLKDGLEATRAISRSRIIQLQRSRDVASTRIHTLFREGKAPLLLGRQGGPAQLILDDETVSKQHAELRFTKKGWILRDLGSQNGTFVEGKQLPEDLPVRLRVGMGLSFSSYRAMILGPSQVYGLSNQLNQARRG